MSSPSPTHDQTAGHRTDIPFGRPGEWRKARRSGTGGGAACVEMAAGVLKPGPDGSSRFVPDRRGVARRQARFPLGRLHRLKEQVKEFAATLPEDEAQVCLNLVAEVTRRLYPDPEIARGGFVHRAEVADDTVVGSASSLRYLNLPPARWGQATDWPTLIKQVPRAGTVVVTFGRPGDLGHAVALVDSDAGVQVIDPHTNRELEIYPAPGQPGAKKLETDMPALVNARALTIKSDGTTTAPKPVTRQSDSIAAALTDPVDPRIGSGRGRSRAAAGQAHNLTLDAVQSANLTNFENRQVGITFDSPQNIVSPAIFNDGNGVFGSHWVGERIAIMDVGQSEVNAAIQRNSFRWQTTPWGDQAAFFVVIGNRSEADIRDGLFPVIVQGNQQLRVDGATLAHLVSSSGTFKSFAKANGNPAVVLLTNHAAGSGRGAAEFSRALKSRSKNAKTVYAYSGSLSTSLVMDRGARVPVSFIPSDSGAWTRFKGERQDEVIAASPGSAQEVHVLGYLGAGIDEEGAVAMPPNERVRLIGLQTNITSELVDENDEMIGVALGVDNRDAQVADRWARSGGSEQLRSHPIQTNDGTHWVGHQWDEIAGDNPFIIVGHNSGLYMSGGLVRVNGSAVALALMRTEEFKRRHAPGVKPPTSYILVSCSTGRHFRPGGAAYDFQQTLAHHGYIGPVIAATRIVTIVRDGQTRVDTGGVWRLFGPRRQQPSASGQRPSRNNAAPDPRLEVQFPGKGLEVDTAQYASLADLAARVGEEAVSRYRQRRPGLVVNIEGGGNGGTFSRGADVVGGDRAAAVSQIMRPIIDQLLSGNGVPATAVAYSVRSRGDRPTASPYRPAPGSVKEQNRRVQVWVAQGVEQSGAPAQNAAGFRTTHVSPSSLTRPYYGTAGSIPPAPALYPGGPIPTYQLAQPQPAQQGQITWGQYPWHPQSPYYGSSAGAGSSSGPHYMARIDTATGLRRMVADLKAQGLQIPTTMQKLLDEHGIDEKQIKPSPAPSPHLPGPNDQDPRMAEAMVNGLKKKLAAAADQSTHEALNARTVAALEHALAAWTARHQRLTSGEQPEPVRVPAIPWTESSHSAPLGPNGEKACVQVTVVEHRIGRGLG